jgi:mitogen-activated protein kinase 6
MYPGAADKAVDLLTKMLQFDPRVRITVNEALGHPFFADIRNASLESTARSPMSFDLENSFESAENLRASVTNLYCLN